MIVHSRRRCLLTQFLECCMYIVHLYIQYCTEVTIWSWNIIFWFSRTLGLCLLCYCLLCMISDFFAHDLKVTSYLSMKVSDLFSRDLEVGDLFPLSEGQWPLGSWSEGPPPYSETHVVYIYSGTMSSFALTKRLNFYVTAYSTCMHGISVNILLCANILVGIRNIAYTKRTCLVKKVLDVHGL